MVKFLIPLGGHSAWSNNELKYMLRSLEAKCSFEFEVHAYVNQAPEWLTNVKLIQVDRFYPQRLLYKYDGEKPYENYFDTLNKLKSFCEANKGEKFIYIYDDVLLLEKIYCPSYIQNIANEPNSSKKYKVREKTKHGRTVNKSVDILNSLGLNNILIYETHIPRVYNSDLMLEMFEKYDFTKMDIPYAPATLYFNLYDYESSELPPLSEMNNIRAMFYFDDNTGDAGSVELIQKEIDGKMWMNYNNKGLNTRGYDGSGRCYLKQWIIDRFPNKSKYEK